ncbi:MAG: signal peptidase II [Chloroflexota bacterium]|nr:signal peptidase II [Chloroflexota bacterium]
MQKGQFRRQGRFLLIGAAFVIALDQWSKAWIRDNLALGESLPEKGLLRLIHTTNTGSAFGLFPNQTLFLIIISVAILLVIPLVLRYLITHYHSSSSGLCAISLGIILGGAVGNLIDRLRFGFVTDFILVRLWNNFLWPAFNLADASIVIGTFALLYALFRAGVFKQAHDDSCKSTK